jgi:predicted MFS family arabinose efflux permease
VTAPAREAESAAEPARPLFSPRYVNGVVAVLTGAVAVEFLHRQLLAVALEPLRRDLALSDTQAGALVTAFAAAYFAAALVLGRLADRWSRRGIYALGIALWSLATAAGAAAGGFAAFLLTRLAVGAGQAAAGACNGPLVADFVPPHKRASAIGLITVGATLGIVVAMGAGGALVAAFGWRALFAAGGALGLVCAVAFFALVREPPRGWSEGHAHTGEEVPVREVLATLGGLRTLRHMVAGLVVTSMAMFAAAQWMVAFFERVHGFSSSGAGALGGLGAAVGAVGGIAGGVITNRVWLTHPHLVLFLPALGVASAFPATLFATQSSHGVAAGVVLALGMGAALLHSAPVGSVMQALTPIRMRAFASALLNAILTLTGMGLGPLFTGLLSDAFGAARDPAALGRALACVSILYVWGALHLALASRSFAAELRQAQHAAG